MQHYIFISAAFFAGMLAMGLVAYFVRARERSAIEATLAERQRLMERENKLTLDELKSRTQLECEKNRLERERENRERESELRSREEEVKSSHNAAEKERELYEKRRAEVESKLLELEKLENRLREEAANYRKNLYEISKLNPEAVKKEIFAEVHRECEDEIRSMRDEKLSRSEKETQREARNILVACMQRMSSTPQEDISATVVPLPSDDMKGRIIGREGRNIKSFESMTGTTLLIDETPDSVLVSSFDPVRREIARIALESLIKDGRIHPSSIEAAVLAAEDEVKQSVVESGEDALRRLRLNKMHPEIVAALGQMRFRLSNNQNLLEHSIEVANLCALIASELNLDSNMAKRAGLLHDIGKVLDQEHDGSHAKVGAFFLKRIGNEEPEVINAVAAHHEEVPAESPYVGLVMIADSLSAVRPGARADSMDGYIQRIRSLESIARAIDGVTDAYAIQAGREIRVVVSPEKFSEPDALMLARKIRRQIEEELQYPGTIKITVIREQRFEEVAK